MRAQRVVATAVALAAAVCGGCGVDDVDTSGGWCLEGSWGVSAVRYDGIVVDEYLIFIEQQADSVALWRRDERICVGEVRADTLFCTDWPRYAISRIFIGDWRHMYSETPGNESLRVILFERRLGFDPCRVGGLRATPTSRTPGSPEHASARQGMEATPAPAWGYWW